MKCKFPTASHDNGLSKTCKTSEVINNANAIMHTIHGLHKTQTRWRQWQKTLKVTSGHSFTAPKLQM